MKYKLPINFLFIAAFAAVFFISACDDTSNITNINSVIIPAQNVSYSKYIQPVLSLYCDRSGCHDDQTSAGNLSVTSWSNVVKGSIVFPGIPETSHLVWVITGLSPNHPFFTPTPNSNQINGIKTWIKEGAKNN